MNIETVPNYSSLLPSQATNFMTSQGLSQTFDQARSFMNRQSTADESLAPSIEEETHASFSKSGISLPFEANESNPPSTLHKQGNQFMAEPADQYNSLSFGAEFTSFGRVFPYIISTSSTPSFVLNSHEGLNNSQACRERNMSFGHGDLQDSRSNPSNTSNMKSGFLNEVTTRSKRRSPSSLSEPKVQSQTVEVKKSKSTLRSSNPPLKVRKEKLGDRITALHILVAPLGKTDTASVLTEAIGYIHFLHDQVQTLSMPYMKSKPSRKTQQVHGFSMDADTELKVSDLTSRGLCLIPVSCASYLNGLD